ncbi:MAG: hypothetical protein HY544_00625 [Candidatus Diapherotrites archaeon]|uniref:Carboxypeptidase regulatory-like domain-containing protein n=1 Tax=Candidatus Iainarchaeum sp. TaxID=3101447 RepID=A0A8T3YK83_9ARCH|nr:hypothetical protein [Candidatus Diapherotrites archaeon]
MAGLADSLGGLYYSLEDRYYEILDGLEENVPVYKVIDPIDKVFPSFILLLIVLLLAISAAIWFIAGGGLASLFAAQTAKFVVVDNDDTRLEGIAVSFSEGARKETKTTNAFGEFRTGFFGKAVAMEVDAEGYAPFRDVNGIEPGKSYRIRLSQEAADVKLRTISFELRGTDNSPVSSTAAVSMSFACSGQGRRPASISGKGSQHAVSVQTDCGVLTSTINATGFEEARKTVDTLSQQGTVIVRLVRKSLFSSVRVVVQDRKTKEPVKGVALTFKMNGVTALQGGATDDSGIALVDKVPYGEYLIEASPPSGSRYSVGFSDLFAVGAAQLSGDVTIYLDKADSSKILRLRFLDEATGRPVRGVAARFVVNNNVSGISLASDASGIVEFINPDAKAAYAAIATHADYVLRVVTDIGLVDPSSASAKEVKLLKATSANSGTAMVLVSELSVGPVKDAAVQLYSIGVPFPLFTGQTGDDGNVSFTNLPLGDYNAFASKLIDGTMFSNNSARKALAPGAVTQFPIVLVVANGKVSASVTDESGRPVQGVEVKFVDSITGQTLGSMQTGANGSTPQQLELKVDKRPYIVAKKQGYYDATSIPYQITPNSSQVIPVTLIAVKDPFDPYAPFDVRLGAVLDSSGRQVQVMQAKKDYLLSFTLISSGDISDAKTAVRAGLEGEANASDSKIVVRGFTSFAGNATLSPCYNMDNNYTNCGQATETDAKQAIAGFGNLGRGSYDFRVAVYVKDVPRDTPLQVRFGAKASSGGSMAFRPSEKTLYLREFLVDKPFCVSDCGIVMSFTLQDNAKSAFPQPVAVPSTPQPLLLKGQQYKVHYTITNLSNRVFPSVSMALLNKKPPATPQPVTFERAAIPIGRLAALQSAEGDFAFTAASDAVSTEIDVNLDLGISGDNARILVGISALKVMNIEVSPETLLPGMPQGNAVITVIATDKSPVPAASVRIYKDSGETPIDTGATDNAGRYFASFRSAFADGTVLHVRASKSGFVDASKDINVRGTVSLLLPGITCVTAGPTTQDQKTIDSFSLEIPRRRGATGFTLLNNACGQDVILNLRKHEKSDISLKVNGAAYDFAAGTGIILQNNASAQVEVQTLNEFGVHPIYVTARLGGASGQANNAGTVKVIIFDPEVCLSGEKEGFASASDRFTLGSGSSNNAVLAFINKCFTGLFGGAIEGDKYPRNDLASPDVLGGKALVTASSVSGSVEEARSRYTAQVQQIQATEDQFFLVTVQDFVKGGQ